MPLSFLFILILALAFPASAFSQGDARLDPIIVYGEKDRRSAPSSVSQTRIPLREYQDRPLTVTEVLSQQAGVHITRFGGLEESTSISIRGSAGDEVLVLLDGIPLNSAEGGAVDLSPYQVDDLESISVFKTISPISTGLFPAAGTISLESAKPKEGTHGNASLSYGSFQTIRGHGLISTTTDKSGFVFSMAGSGTDGNFSFLDDNGTPFNTADDAVVSRQNNSSRTLHPFLKIYHDLDAKTRLQFVTHFIRKDQGVPGLSTNQSETADLSRTEWLSGLRLKRDSFLTERLSLESFTYFRHQKSQYSDPAGEIGLGGAQDNDTDTLLFGQKEVVEYFWGKSQILTGFFLFQFERFAPEDFLANPDGESTSRRYQWNTGLSDEIRLLEGKLTFTPSVWVENVTNRISSDDPSFIGVAALFNDRSHHHVSAQLSAKGRPLPWLTLSGHVNRNARYPTFSELFGDRGGLVGNPFLDPQTSLNWDGGFIVDLAKLVSWLPRSSLSAAYFDRHVDDLIQFEQNAGFVRAENIGKAHVHGVETQLRAELLNHVGLTFNYTHQRAKDETTGNFLPGRPRNELYAQLEGWLGKGRGFVEMNWIDSNFLDPLNTRVVDGRTLLNAGLSYRPLKGLTLAFEGKNLTDQRIVDVVGFPLPGRSFMGKVNYAF